jgi:hypothetical protein
MFHVAGAWGGEWVVDGEAMVHPGKVATSHVLDVLESLQAYVVCIRVGKLLVVKYICDDVVYSSYCCLEINAC